MGNDQFIGNSQQPTGPTVSPAGLQSDLAPVSTPQPVGQIIASSPRQNGQAAPPASRPEGQQPKKRKSWKVALAVLLILIYPFCLMMTLAVPMLAASSDPTAPIQAMFLALFLSAAPPLGIAWLLRKE